jgi:hypothetical protein
MKILRKSLKLVEYNKRKLITVPITNPEINLKNSFEKLFIKIKDI